MKTYITQEQAGELAKASGFTVHRGLGLLQSVPEDVFGHGLISKEIHALCNAAIQHYRDSLVAGVVLPEPALKQMTDDRLYGITPVDYYTADQLRQAIADALSKLK